MSGHRFSGFELLPHATRARQLFVLLHDAGAAPSQLAPFAHQLHKAYPGAAVLIPDAMSPCERGGRQWFSEAGITEENRPARVAAAMPALHARVKDAQDRLGILPTDTALAGFAQGAIMALEFSAAHDGAVGRVLAFGGRYARLPDSAPQLTTIHLLHGENDSVIPAAHARAALEQLAALHGDVTLDIASSVGHEMHPSLMARAIYRLQTCVPLRSWERAQGL